MCVIHDMCSNNRIISFIIFSYVLLQMLILSASRRYCYRVCVCVCQGFVERGGGGGWDFLPQNFQG